MAGFVCTEISPASEYSERLHVSQWARSVQQGNKGYLVCVNKEGRDNVRDVFVRCQGFQDPGATEE